MYGRGATAAWMFARRCGAVSTRADSKRWVFLVPLCNCGTSERKLLLVAIDVCGSHSAVWMRFEVDDLLKYDSAGGKLFLREYLFSSLSLSFAPSGFTLFVCFCFWLCVFCLFFFGFV